MASAKSPKNNSLGGLLKRKWFSGKKSRGRDDESTENTMPQALNVSKKALQNLLKRKWFIEERLRFLQDEKKGLKDKNQRVLAANKEGAGQRRDLSRWRAYAQMRSADLVIEVRDLITEKKQINYQLKTITADRKAARTS